MGKITDTSLVCYDGSHREKMKNSNTNPQQVNIRYSSKLHGWVVDGSPGKVRVFASETEAENYCIYKLRKFPLTNSLPNRTRFQELPHRSVWTGAPWDRSFAR